MRRRRRRYAYSRRVVLIGEYVSYFYRDTVFYRLMYSTRAKQTGADEARSSVSRQSVPWNISVAGSHSAS